MTILWQEQLKPGVALDQIVRQATAALVSMDASRLEELALCCADLNRELKESGQWGDTARTLVDARQELKLLELVLQETRANLSVLSRLRALRQMAWDWQQLYDGRDFDRWPWPGRSSEYGDD